MIKKILNFYFNIICFYFKKSNTFPKISIIIPFYNDKKFILQTLVSVSKQSYKNFECILVDDCSTDGTRSLVESFILNKTNFKLISHSHNKGLPAARNTGLKEAQGSFVNFLDADDILFVHSLWFRIGKMSSKNSDAIIGVFGGCIYFPEAGVSILSLLKTYIPILQERIVYYPIWNGEYPFVVHSPLLKTSEVKKLGGFDESYTDGAEDYEFWLRCLKNGYYFERCEYFVAGYRQKASSMLKDALLKHSEIFKNLLQNSHKENDITSLRPNTVFHFVEDYRVYQSAYVLQQRILKLAYYHFIRSGEIKSELLGLLDKKLLKIYAELIINNDLRHQALKLLPLKPDAYPSIQSFKLKILEYCNETKN